MIFQTFSLSKAGGRKINEDYCAHLQLADRACWLVADGLGGHKGGSVASRTVVEAFLRTFREIPFLTEESLSLCLTAAEQYLRKTQEENVRLSAMMTTLVSVVSDYKKAVWAHAGDSRLYIFRKGALLFQTEDHSIPQSLVKGGFLKPEEIRYHEDRNRLVKAMGRESTNPSINLTGHAFARGDVMLLCTDGFWEHVLEEEMEAALGKAESPERWLLSLEELLLQRVTGEHDNYTGIAVFIT